MLPEVASLWLGPRLTFLEQVCLKSFHDMGHPVTLFSYEKIQNLPEGVKAGNAEEILPLSQITTNKASKSPAPFSDKFRYHMLKKTNLTWVDTDACCLRPFPDEPYLFGKYFNGAVNNCILRLPSTSPTLDLLLDLVSTEYPDLPKGFYNSRPNLVKYRQRRKAGEMVHVSELDHETWGPHALSFFLQQTDEYKYAMEEDVFNPVPAYWIGKTVRPKEKVDLVIPENSLSVHFYGTRIRDILRKIGGQPKKTSFLDELCKKHGIASHLAPVQ